MYNTMVKVCCVCLLVWYITKIEQTFNKDWKNELDQEEGQE